jgi:hypothetical protein
MSAKIYKIERKGRTVRAWWGPACWNNETKRPEPATADCLQSCAWKFGSVKAAEEFLQGKLEAKVEKGYDKNPRRRNRER